MAHISHVTCSNVNTVALEIIFEEFFYYARRRLTESNHFKINLNRCKFGFKKEQHDITSRNVIVILLGILLALVVIIAGKGKLYTYI